MTIGHRLSDDELSDTSIYELYSQLGAHDTPQLFERPFVLNTEFDIPSAGGNSIDRKTKYIDRTLYQEVMDGEFKTSGLTPQQIIDRWLDHEHCEKCIVDGDNAVDDYLPAHKRALRREHEGVLAILGRDNALDKIRHYEAAIWPGITRAYHREIKKVPVDLWCAPYLDDPSERDEEILAHMQELGVADAGKRDKYGVRYGMGPKNCGRCANWHPAFLSQEHGSLSGCRRVTGLVRQDRHCDLWMPAKGSA